MELPTTNARQGEVVLVSPEDYAKLSEYKWAILRQHRDGYTIRYVYRSFPVPGDSTQRRKEYLHRVVLGLESNTVGRGQAPGGIVVDHINGDGLDNRRDNLRAVSISENQLNRHRGRTAFGKRRYEDDAR